MVGFDRSAPHGVKVVTRAGAEGFVEVFEGDTVDVDIQPAVAFKQKGTDEVATHGDGVLIGALQGDLPDARVKVGQVLVHVDRGKQPNFTATALVAKLFAAEQEVGGVGSPGWSSQYVQTIYISGATDTADAQFLQVNLRVFEVDK